VVVLEELWRKDDVKVKGGAGAGGVQGPFFLFTPRPILSYPIISRLVSSRLLLSRLVSSPVRRKPSLPSASFLSPLFICFSFITSLPGEGRCPMRSPTVLSLSLSLSLPLPSLRDCGRNEE
jgi:hypothetical protein